MVPVCQASTLVLSHSSRPVATQWSVASIVFVVLGHGDTEACWLSKSLLDGKHKVINLRPAGRTQAAWGGPAGLFGEEIPWSLWKVSGGNGLFQLALPPK